MICAVCGAALSESDQVCSRCRTPVPVPALPPPEAASAPPALSPRPWNALQLGKPKSVSGLGAATVIMLLGSAVIAVFGLAMAVLRIGLIDRMMAGEQVPMSEINLSDRMATAYTVLNLTVFWAAAVVYIVWLWRARKNTEVYAPGHEHARHRLWVIFGWITPLVQFWFPFQVVRDVWDASRPPDTDYTKPDPTFRLIVAWWCTFVGIVVFNRVTVRRTADTLPGLLTESRTIIASSLIQIAAAVLAALVVWRITRLQDRRYLQVLAAATPTP